MYSQHPVIKLENVNFSYQNQQHILKDISFSVKKGEWLAIIGHNGSGKSTLAKIINGLLEATSGNVVIDGTPLNEDTLPVIRKKIGMVFQNPDNQFVGTTVADDVAFGLENIGMPHQQMVEKIDHALELVHMIPFKKKEPSRLSGGQKQRVAIAGILALHPEVIILDEATSMLDPNGRGHVLDVIRKLHREMGLTILSITHDLDEAAQADRVLLLEKGEVKTIASPAELFVREESLLENGLDLPFSEKVKRELKHLGISVPDEYMDEERMCQWIWTSLLNK